MKLIKLLTPCFLSLLIPAATFAVTVTGSFGCGAGTQSTSYTFTSATDSTSCSLNSNGYSISGSASASLTELSMSSTQPAAQSPFYSVSAGGQIQENYTITANAPSQAGYIVITGYVANSLAGIAPYVSDGWAFERVYSSDLSVFKSFDSTGLNSATYTVPVTLGQTLNVSMLVQMSTGAPTDYSIAQLSYQFYTADGTPVGAIIDAGAAPEPGSFPLLGLGLVGGLFLLRKRK